MPDDVNLAISYMPHPWLLTARRRPWSLWGRLRCQLQFHGVLLLFVLIEKLRACSNTHTPTLSDTGTQGSIWQTLLHSLTPYIWPQFCRMLGLRMLMRKGRTGRTHTQRRRLSSHNLVIYFYLFLLLNTYKIQHENLPYTMPKVKSLTV